MSRRIASESGVSDAEGAVPAWQAATVNGAIREMKRVVLDMLVSSSPAA